MYDDDRFFFLCLDVYDFAFGRYPGSYARFLELKEDRMHAEGAARDNARNKMRGELAWMRKQPKARQAKSKARQDRFFELKAKVRQGAPRW